MATGVRAIPVTGEWPLARQPEPPALILDELTCYHFRVLDPRLPLRSGNSYRGSLLLPLSRQHRLDTYGSDRLWPELDLQPVDGVIGADLTEDHL